MGKDVSVLPDPEFGYPIPSESGAYPAKTPFSINSAWGAGTAYDEWFVQELATPSGPVISNVILPGGCSGSGPFEVGPFSPGHYCVLLQADNDRDQAFFSEPWCFTVGGVGNYPPLQELQYWDAK